MFILSDAKWNSSPLWLHGGRVLLRGSMTFECWIKRRKKKLLKQIQFWHYTEPATVKNSDVISIQMFEFIFHFKYHICCCFASFSVENRYWSRHLVTTHYIPTRSLQISVTNILLLTNNKKNLEASVATACKACHDKSESYSRMLFSQLVKIYSRVCRAMHNYAFTCWYLNYAFALVFTNANIVTLHWLSKYR